jgi:hypothetical protein
VQIVRDPRSADREDPMSVAANGTTTTIRPAVRIAGICGTVGALGYIGLELGDVAAQLRPALDPVGLAVLGAVSSVLMISAVYGLALSGAAGRGWSASVGLWAAGLGWAAIAAGYVVSAAIRDDAWQLFVLGSALSFIGMGTAGVAVVRFRSWTGWRRWVPLSCAGYLLAASPFFGAEGSAAGLAGAGLGLCWLALGVALLTAPQK